MSQQTLNKNCFHSSSHYHHHTLKQANQQRPPHLQHSPQQQQDFRNDRQHQQLPVKMGTNTSQTVVEGAQVQRKLFSFLYIYAILIVALYASYAAYYFYQHHRHRQQRLQPIGSQLAVTEAPTVKMALAAASANQDQDQQQQLQTELEARLESKIHLLERYIEVIAVDLQETKNRLLEREKCDCSVSCTFNGTRYADRSSWQNQCDVCTCQSGRISCVPQKCPLTNCDDAIRMPGQCCPTCMKKCKYNDRIICHGQKFKPTDSTRGLKTKECKCYDGRIRCEQVQAVAAKALVVVASSKSATITSATNSTGEAIRAASYVAAANNATTAQKISEPSVSFASSQETVGREGQMTADDKLPAIAMPSAAVSKPSATVAAAVLVATASPLSASDRQLAGQESLNLAQQRQRQESAASGIKNEAPPIAANKKVGAPNVREAHENG